MASVFIALLLLFPYFVSPDTRLDKSHVINHNERIHANTKPSAWYSPSGRLAFGFLPQGDGILVGIWIVDDISDINSQNMVWTANRDSPPVSSNATIELTQNGKLVLNADIGEILIADPTEPVAFASMHDTGNFVLYGKGSNAIWESFSFPTDTILGGQKLPAEHQLFSKASPSNFSTGRFRLKMQSDGNLVAYPSKSNDIPTYAYWATETNDYIFLTRYYYLHLDNDGRLKLKGRLNSSAFKQLNGNYSGNTLTTIYHATLDPNGNFGVYFNTSTDPLWTAFNGTCEMRSFCGFNSYCTQIDYQSSCFCIPGTDFINYTKKDDGCQRNFTKQNCREGKADITSYDIITIQQLSWRDVPYFNAPLSEEDCKNSCLEDCDCDAAEYDSNTCNKHKFPLRYGKRDIQKNFNTFFKVGTRGIENGNRTIHPESVVHVTSKKTWLLILLLSLGLVAYSCVALAISGLFIFKSRVMVCKRLLESGTSGLARELALRLYSYKELNEATKGFKEELGRGLFWSSVQRNYKEWREACCCEETAEVGGRGRKRIPVRNASDWKNPSQKSCQAPWLLYRRLQQVPSL